MTQSEYIDGIQRRVKDEESKLSAEDWSDVLADALAEYGRRNPARALEEIEGDGTAFLDVPAGWEEDVSTVVRLEELDSELIPSEIRNNALRLEERPGLSPRIMRTLGYFSGGVTYRLVYTVSHAITAESSSVPSGDNGALMALAASIACTRLAAAYAQSLDQNFGAITNDNSRRPSEYRSLAKDYLAEFERLMSSSQSARPAGKLKTWKRESPLLLHS